MSDKKMITEKTWEEFQSIGLLWFVNRLLHLFGWAIVFSIDIESRKILQVFPARVRFRGFHDKDETEGFHNLTNYLHNNSSSLLEDFKNDNGGSDEVS